MQRSTTQQSTVHPTLSTLDVASHLSLPVKGIKKNHKATILDKDKHLQSIMTASDQKPIVPCIKNIYCQCKLHHTRYFHAMYRNMRYAPEEIKQQRNRDNNYMVRCRANGE